MTEIKVDPDQLKELADGIQKSEDKVDDALGKLSWTFSSFLVGITQANTGRIKDVQAELEHHMKKYQSKLDELQEGVMLTRAQILEADKNGWDKTGEFGLELLGVYDAERIFAEYDPVTGKKITGWQRALATGMTLATLFPPAKGVLLLGKMGVKGLKALKLIENGAEVIKQTKNVLNPAVLKKMAQASYNTVIKGPIAKTSAYLKQTAENVKNIELNMKFIGFEHLNRFEPALETIGGVPGKTIGEIGENISKATSKMFGNAKEAIVRFSVKTRLPRNNGKWKGEPGEGLWYSNKPEVKKITNNEGVEFKKGRPNFTPWSQGKLVFEKGSLNGTSKDFNLVYEQIQKQYNLPSKNAAKKLLKQAGVTPHHKSDTLIELVPTDLHKNVPHVGSASDLRGGNY